jgi:hypothetical protein
MWNNLRFFNGLTSELQFTQVDGIWEGKIYMPIVSTQLYETVNLFILEDAVDANGDGVINTPIAPDNGTLSFDFKWEPTRVFQSEDIIMYGYDMKDNKPFIKELKTQSKDLDEFSNIVSQDANNLKTIAANTNVAIQINIALNSTKEGIHRRILEIKAGSDIVARIDVYGEVEGEDERLKVLLSNLGNTLQDSDFLLFKSHDITENAPDQVLMNQKRKELLLELHNIKPFVGTYKAILNAIDFFGYDKITLKEYWINVDKSESNFGKLHAIPVPNSSVRGEMIRKRLKFKVPSSTKKKTSRFSLVYRLNETNGQFDQWDIPKVDEVFDYTPDEVIIKLYGLKNRLQKDYLPLEAKIVDITGEGDYFTNRNLNMWNVKNSIGYFTEGHKVKYQVFPNDRDLFIEDISNVLSPSLSHNIPANNYDTFLNLTIGDEGTLTEAQRTELKTAYRTFYETYHDRDLHSYNKDIPIGCPVILDGVPSFDDVWDEANFVWNDAVDANANLKVTWDNWWKKWVYEIEWLIDGPNGFHQEYRGAIDDYKQLPLSLPFAGSYTVEMRTYDLFGHMSFYKTKDLFEVKLKDLELYGIYKWLDTDINSMSQTWNSKSLNWNGSGGYWDFAQDNQTIVDDNIATMYLTLDRANYVHSEDSGIRFSTVSRYKDIYSETGYSETTGPYQWDESTFRWKDTDHLWWEAMRVGPDLAASFKIDWIEQGDVLRIVHKHPVKNTVTFGDHTITTPTPINAADFAGWNSIIAELEASTDPIISKFNYNGVFEDLNDNDNAQDINDKFWYILCTGQEYSKTYDFQAVTIIKANNSSNAQISGEVHTKHYNPTWDDTRVFKHHATVDRSTHVTISTDISKFPGAKNPKWTITNLSNPEITDIYYNNMWLTYIFKEPGDYSILLDVEDTYNNKNVIRRNMIKVK